MVQTSIHLEVFEELSRLISKLRPQSSYFQTLVTSINHKILARSGELNMNQITKFEGGSGLIVRDHNLYLSARKPIKADSKVLGWSCVIFKISKNEELLAQMRARVDKEVVFHSGLKVYGSTLELFGMEFDFSKCETSFF